MPNSSPRSPERQNDKVPSGLDSIKEQLLTKMDGMTARAKQAMQAAATETTDALSRLHQASNANRDALTGAAIDANRIEDKARVIASTSDDLRRLWRESVDRSAA